MGRGSARVRLRGMGRSSVGAKLWGMGKDSIGPGLRGMGSKGGQKSPFFMNTISSYYIPLQDNLGIIFPKFEVPSINDGSHRGK